MAHWMAGAGVTSRGLYALLMAVPSFALADEPAQLPPPPASSPPAASPKPPPIRPRKPPRVRGAGTAATIDGSWALALHVNSALSIRAWDAPYPWGTLGQYSARVLYGFSWTMMMSIEALTVVTAHGGRLDWIGEGSYRSDWIMPVDAPLCSSVGAAGGCGIGVGGFSFIGVRPRSSRWWYEAGGGWIQQRISNDALRTVAESSWVLTPISAVHELRTDLDAPVAFRLFAGPGLYFGMHAAHMHPTTGGRDMYRDAPWTQLYPLSAGIGPGARVEGRMIFGRHLSLEAELVAAPFLIGGPIDGVASDVAPLDHDRHGITVWRKTTLGIGWDDPKNWPFKATVAFFASELSERPLDRIGHRGGMIRFDIPLEIRNGDR